MRLPLTSCPHCKRTGFLILHGYLEGYAEASDDRIRRGRRIFCSNRFSKAGCGRMFQQKKCVNKSDFYRACIEKGILRKEQIAWTTFYRFVREYELLTDDPGDNHKRRLAFAMQYANQLWQGDTLFGPYLTDAAEKPKQSISQAVS